MDNSYYESAYKAGQKYYKQCLLNERDPYLPVLNQIIPEHMVSGASAVGLQNIPAEKIVGTLTMGRSKSFAGNFMPIEKESSEFAMKWKSLANSQQTEGIRDPVLLYEYMHRYYVQEGNKRVSVLKFFNTVTIQATVRRILPEKTDDPKVVAYYEFLEFSKATGIIFLELTEPGAYAEFSKLVGKKTGEVWTEDEVRKIRTLYYQFRKNLIACGGDKIAVEAGDALLACIRIFGFEDMYEFSDSEMKKAINKVWEEISLQGQETKIEMKLDPEEQPKKVISKLLAPKTLKVAFFYLRNKKESNWVAAHELGRMRVEQKLGSKIETSVYICQEEEDIEYQLTRAVIDGANVIFATSAEMLPACLKAAVDAPDVAIMNCSLNKPHRYVRVYYPRMYEAKFVEGAIAGAISDSDKIGYVCKYPVYGSAAEINAFARGLKMTNPRAKLYLEWSGVKNAGNVVKKLTDQGIKLISMRDYQEKESFRQFYGLELVENGELTPLVLPVWNWGVFYEWVLNSILNGTYKSEKDKTPKSLLYHWGLGSGVIEMFFASQLPKEVRYLGELLTRSICDGTCKPFYEPEAKADGRIIWETMDRALSPEDILEIGTLEENVIGHIPVYEELTEQAQKLIDVIGLDSAKKVFEKPASAAAGTVKENT